MSDENRPEEYGMSLNEQDVSEQQERKSRRDFLRRLGRWSAIIIGGAALGGMMEPPEADAAVWLNGGSWVNARGGGGGGWVNRAGGGGGSWVNRGGGGWVNRGGGSWVNRRG